MAVRSVCLSPWEILSHAAARPGGGDLWSRVYGGSADDDVLGLALNSSDNVIFGGTFQGTADVGKSVTVPANSTGGYVTKLVR